MLSRDQARSRPPTDRPLDIVGLELLLCTTQALLAGVLLTVATDLGGDAKAVGLPVPGLLALLGLAVGTGWLWWLVGGSGWPLAAVDLAVGLLTGALWLLSLQDATAPHLDPLVGLVAVACAIYGIIAGVFLPGPRRRHWKGGISQPRRGLTDTRTSPARFSPPVQKLVDERLARVSFSRVTLPARRLPSTQPPAAGLAAATAPATVDTATEPIVAPADDDEETLPFPAIESGADVAVSGADVAVSGADVAVSGADVAGPGADGPAERE